MSQTREDALVEVIDEVRGLFHELRLVAQEVHGGSSLAGGTRGVLVDLLKDGDQTVPELARRRPVSRQHIQVLVNDLLSEGLVTRESNPMHKRSKLVALTPKGRRTIVSMLERELTLLRDLPLRADHQDLMGVAESLRALRTAIRNPGWRQHITEG